MLLRLLAIAIVLVVQMRGVSGESRRRGGWRRGSVFGIAGCGLLRVSISISLVCETIVDRLVVTHFLRVQQRSQGLVLAPWWDLSPS